MAQFPPVQLGVPFSELHSVLQLPQCSASVVRLVSQPEAGSPSQSPKPPLQLNPQLAFAHLRAAFVCGGQTLPQPLQ